MRGTLTTWRASGDCGRYKSSKQKVEVIVGQVWKSRDTKRVTDGVREGVRITAVSSSKGIEVQNISQAKGSKSSPRWRDPSAFLGGFELHEDVRVEPTKSPPELPRSLDVIRDASPPSPTSEDWVMHVATAFENLGIACRTLAASADEYKQSALAIACLGDEGCSDEDVKKACKDLLASTELMAGRTAFRLAMVAIREASAR